MSRRLIAIPICLLALVAGAAAGSSLARADQMSRIPRIGVLAVQDSPNIEGLREGLRELGYVEGKNFTLDWPQFGGSTEQANSLAAELVHSGVDLIAASGTPAALGAMQATTTVPIVFNAGDPVWSKLGVSLSRPGRNATGVSVLSTELYPKRLEYLHHLALRARRIAFLMNSANPMGTLQLEEVQNAARKLGVQIETFDARNIQELDGALQAMRASKPDAIFVGGDTIFLRAVAKIAEAVRTTKLPAIFPYREYHAPGALMSYGPSMKDVGRRVAGYVDKILKGAKPSGLPIEQVTKYELIINLRQAREIGIEVPPELLLRADEVIR
jgi:putative tryptophan/tyrosine transport system substrate-binding protein